MSPTEWIVFAIVVSGAAGVLVGYGIAWGRQQARSAQHGKLIDQLGDVIGKLGNSFAECQRRGAECASSTRVLVDAQAKRLAEIQMEFMAHKASVHQHHEQQDIHTTAEWRKNVMERLTGIEHAFEKKMDDQTETLLGRIESVERLVRNGNGGK